MSNRLISDVLEIANNAIYFGDRKEYLTALWDICIKLGMNEDDVGKKFMEPEIKDNSLDIRQILIDQSNKDRLLDPRKGD